VARRGRDSRWAPAGTRGNAASSAEGEDQSTWWICSLGSTLRLSVSCFWFACSTLIICFTSRSRRPYDKKITTTLEDDHVWRKYG
jgi:hypothetical protein